MDGVPFENLRASVVASVRHVYVIVICLGCDRGGLVQQSEAEIARETERERERERRELERRLLVCRPAAPIRNSPSCMNLSPNLFEADNAIFTRSSGLGIE